MKIKLHYVLTLISSFIATMAFSQANEPYFREGFEPGAGWPTASYTTPQYIVGSSGATFYGLGTYRTTGGTGACITQTGGASHARFPNINATDSAYLVTPIVYSGIYRVRFYNGRASRRFTILKTNTTDPATATWTEVIFLPATNAACDLVDVLVNDPNATMLKIVARAGTDSDIDSLSMTSMNPILPVTFTSIKAIAEKNAVKVEWDIATESDVLHYIVERAGDSKEFAAIATIASKGNTVSAVRYSSTDEAPQSGNNYYRVKAVDKDGSFKYSSTVRVNTYKGKTELSVAPNPVRNHELNVQISSLMKGEYTVRVFNNVGQVVFAGKLNADGGSFNKSFRLPSTVRSGVYTLQVAGNDINLNRKIMVE